MGDHGDDGGADPHRLGRGEGKTLQKIRGDDEHVGADAAAKDKEGLNFFVIFIPWTKLLINISRNSYFHVHII